MGKTTLAIEAARSLLDAFEHGAWFVDLAPVTDAGLVESTIAAALGSTTDPREHLRDREVLLVLDNFEQVVDAAGVVGEILEDCPGVAVLATSRESLRIRAEREFPLRELDAEAAATLFRERAGAVLPTFEADPAVLADLVRRLEGIPLAIELAAARVKLLSLDQIVERLDSRLSLLTGGARDLPERQRTLEATIAWSYALLNEGERGLFARLAVFTGGWTLDAAEQVCDADLNALQSLVDKSLVRPLDGRFTMLESIGEYARARFGESAEGERPEHRHALYYLALAERAEPELTGRNQHMWLERVAADYENLRTALEWCSNTPEHVPEGLRIGSSLVMFWFVRGPYRDGVRWLEPLLAKSEGDRSSVRAGALWGAGLMWTLIGDGERGQFLLEQCLELAREQGDDSRTARALSIMGILAFFSDDATGARALLEESVTHARAAGDDWCLTDGLATLGSIYPLQGEPELAVAAATEALEMALGAGEDQGLRMSLFALALAAFRRGDLSEARKLGEEGLAVVRELGDRWFTPYFLWVLATVEAEAGQYQRASEVASECLVLARELEAPMMLVCALDAAAASARCVHDDDTAAALLSEASEVAGSGIVPGSYVSSAATELAKLEAQRGDVEAAEERLEGSLALSRRVGDPWAEARALVGRATLSLARDDHVAAEQDAVDALGLQLRLGDQIGAAASMDIMATAAGGHGDLERAARLCAASDAVRGRVSAVVAPWEANRREELLNRVKGAVGAARYEQLVADLAGVSFADTVRSVG